MCMGLFYPLATHLPCHWERAYGLAHQQGTTDSSGIVGGKLIHIHTTIPLSSKINASKDLSNDKESCLKKNS